MHFLQTDQWAELRAEQGHIPVRVGDALMLIKRYPFGLGGIGVMTMVELQDIDWQILAEQASVFGLSHVLIEPADTRGDFPSDDRLRHAESLMLRHTVLIDLQKSQEELLAEMKKNTRYNIKLAEKKGVEVKFEQGESAIDIFCQLYFGTVEQKGFFGREEKYFRQVWRVLSKSNSCIMAIASYEGEPMVARFLFVDDTTIYTAYTGFSRKNPQVKAAYAALWQVMLWGKNNGKQFINLWGIKPGVDESHPEYGYTQFKLGFGGRVISYLPSKDWIASPLKYKLFKTANSVRWLLLKIKKRVVA